MTSPLTPLRVLLAGESFWKVELRSGKTLSELDTKPVYVEGRAVLVRRLEWLEDIISSGDIARVKSVFLVTPRGTASIAVRESYTAFQFCRGTLAVDPGRGTRRACVSMQPGIYRPRNSTGDATISMTLCPGARGSSPQAN
jgi:hypothetical protein